jgi:Fic family protein
MVYIEKKTLGNNNYYYLEHNYRKNGKIHKKVLYIGRKIPENIKKIKKDFLKEIYEEQWFKQFNLIQKNFLHEKKLTPKSAKEKEIGNFAVKFTYHSNKIEGSTLTLRETANLLDEGITPNRRPVSDVKETEAHKEVFYDMLRYNRTLSLQTVLHWHKMLFQYTKKDIAGRIRNHQVAISGSKYTPPYPAGLDFHLMEFFKWYSEKKNKIHPVQLAASIHLKFVTIHPFSDGNGRISRILMNHILNKNAFPMLIVPYGQRNSYYTALERSQLKKDENVFVLWFFKRYLKEYNNYLR